MATDHPSGAAGADERSVTKAAGRRHRDARRLPEKQEDTAPASGVPGLGASQRRAPRPADPTRRDGSASRPAAKRSARPSTNVDGVAPDRRRLVCTRLSTYDRSGRGVLTVPAVNGSADDITGAPFRRLADGTRYYGELGRVACDRDADRVQCHLCGRWLKTVGGSHLLRASERYRIGCEGGCADAAGFQRRLVIRRGRDRRGVRSQIAGLRPPVR